jgi:hypothetical protein
MTLPLALAGAPLSQPKMAAQSAMPWAHVPSYDIVSIETNKSGTGSVNDANFDATNISLKTLVLQAYSLKESQLFGLPRWDGSTRFDIEAKIIAPDGKRLQSLTNAQRRSMLQPILTDHFHLKFHRDWKLLSVYDLVLTKDGPKFRATKAAQAARVADVNGIRLITSSLRNGSFTTTDVPISTLVDAPPSVANAADAPPDIFTALREQLGFKLKPSKVSIETFTIDHVELPSEN